MTELKSIDDSHLFAATRDGQKVALSRNGLQLFDSETASTKLLSPLSPVVLSWSPDDSALAAAFPEIDYVTRVVIYSPSGELLQETTLPVALTQLTWSVRGDLLATGFRLKVYSFGANLQQALFNVNQNQVTETILADSTLDPSTAKKLVSLLPELQPVSFSPSGDELVFAQLHDPPEFAPFLQLRYMNWQSERRRKLLKLPLQPLELEWVSAEVVIAQISGGSQRIPLWESAEPVQPAVDAYRFDGGRLIRNDELLGDWGEGARLQRLSDGRYLLAVQRKLYLGTGLQPEVTEQYNEKSWTLRRWRFDGLITPTEYVRLIQEEK